MPAIGNMDELVETIGYSRFEALVQARGGRRLYVPTDISNAAQIVQWIGEDSAAKLIEAFGGFHVDVPNRRPTTLPSREPVIRALIDANLSDGEIADKVGCTERWVRVQRSQRREALPGFKQAAAS